MTGASSDLHEHARRLLLGSDLSMAEALALASGQVIGETLLASALRDGWTAAERTGEGGRSR